MIHCLFFYSHWVWSVPLFVVPLRFYWYLFVSTGPTQWPRILAVVLLMSYSMLIWHQLDTKIGSYGQCRKAVVLFAFLVMMSIWLFHDSVLSMVTPRYFALLVSCNTWPWMVYLASMIFFLFVIQMTSHLSGLNNINQSFFHCCKVSRLICNDTASSVVLMVQYHRQSSAKSLPVALTLDNRSLM
jgi:hypothetical protein